MKHQHLIGSRAPTVREMSLALIGNKVVHYNNNNIIIIQRQSGLYKHCYKCIRRRDDIYLAGMYRCTVCNHVTCSAIATKSLRDSLSHCQLVTSSNLTCI